MRSAISTTGTLSDLMTDLVMENQNHNIGYYCEFLEDFLLSAGEHLSADYTKVNPFNKVPAIEDDGFTLTES